MLEYRVPHFDKKKKKKIVRPPAGNKQFSQVVHVKIAHHRAQVKISSL